MNGKILLQNMAFYGYHGVYEYEGQHGQRFYIDVELLMDATLAALNDDLNYAIDYTVLYAKIKSLVETRRFKLLEALANNIAEIVLENKYVIETTVRVRKPSVPLPGQLDYVEVAIQRGR